MARIVNEGFSTALLRCDVPGDVAWRVQTETSGGLIQRSIPAKGREIDGEQGWHLVGPGKQATVVLTWWLPVKDWAALWNASQPPPTRTTKIIIQDNTYSTEDTCELKFGTYAMMPRVAKTAG